MIKFYEQKAPSAITEKYLSCTRERFLNLVGEVFFTIILFIEEKTDCVLYVVYERANPAFNIFISFVPWDTKKNSCGFVWFRVVNAEPKLLLIGLHRINSTFPRSCVLAYPGFLDWLEEACRLAVIIHEKTT